MERNTFHKRWREMYKEMEYANSNVGTPKYIVLEFSILFATINICIRSKQDKFHRIKKIMQLNPGTQRNFKVHGKQCGLEQSQTDG